MPNDLRAQLEHEVVQAVLYAMKHGCFFPMPEPNPRTATVQELIRWGALRHLHDTVAALERPR